MNEFVLKNRNYLLLFVGSVVSNLGTFMYNVAISFYILEITGDNAAIAGVYLATGGIVFFALSLFGGAIVDRLDKVKVVVRTDLLNGITVLIAGFAIFSGLSSTVILIILFVTTVILGINSALFNPAVRSLPPHILEPGQLQQANSMSQGMFALYGIIGGMLGGILYALVDVEVIFIINGASFILSGISESFIQVKTKPDGEHLITIKGTLRDIKEGIQYVVALKPIFYLVAIAALLNFFSIPMIANGLPYLFKAVLVKDAYFLSTLNAMFSIGIIITSIFLASVKQKERVSPSIFKGLFGMALGMMVIALLTQLILDAKMTFSIYMILSAIATLVMGLFNGMINVPFGVAIMKVVEKDKMGRVFSVISIISNGLTPIAMGLGGFVIEQFGLMILFYLAAFATLLTTVLASQNKYVKQL